MIQAGAGISARADTETAAREASEAALTQSGADRADWGMVFMTPHHGGEAVAALDAIMGVLETSDVVGCTGTGVLTHEREIEGSPGIAVLAVASSTPGALSASPLLFRDEGDGGLSIGYELAALIGRPPDGESARAGEAEPGHPAEETQLLVLLTDPHRIQAEQTFRALDSKRSVPVVGTAAGEDGSLGGTRQICGREVLDGALTGLHLRGGFRHVVGVTQGCQPVGLPCVVTRGRGNVVHDLDGRPALAVFAEQVPRALLEANPRLLRSLFVGLSPGTERDDFRPGEYLVRPILGFDPVRGAFAVGGAVTEGQTLTFVMRDPEAAREDLKQMLERVRDEAAGFQPAFGLYFNCAGRGKGLYRMEGIDTAYIESTLGSRPLAGVFGNAEFAPLRGANRMFTYAGVLALIGD